MSNLCQPHFASWCTSVATKTQYMDNGRFKRRPNSFHKVPGQFIAPFSVTKKYRDIFENHYYYECGGESGAECSVAGSWCTTVIAVGQVDARRPPSAGGSAAGPFKVIGCIRTDDTTWVGCAGVNELIGGEKECVGSVPATATDLDNCEHCKIPPPDHGTECANPADGEEHNAHTPQCGSCTTNAGTGIESKCFYFMRCPKCAGMVIPCNPCMEGSDIYPGPSEVLPSTYWSEHFENFLKEFMGINQPNSGAHGCARPAVGVSNPTGVRVRQANLKCPPEDQFDCDGRFNNCSSKISSSEGRPRYLSAPGPGYDRPESKSEMWLDMGSTGRNDGPYAWNFSVHEMRYTNVEDPTQAVYLEYPESGPFGVYPNNRPCDGQGPNSNQGMWNKDIIYFQDGLGNTFPKIGDRGNLCGATSSDCKITWVNVTGWIPNIVRDTPQSLYWPHKEVTRCSPGYDLCWIGWTGGGKGLTESERLAKTKCETTPCKPDPETGEPVRWVRYWDRDLENNNCAPRVMGYDSAKFGRIQWPVKGDIVPVPGWVPPQDRIYDYWCLIANFSTCLNVNLLIKGSDSMPFHCMTTFFHDPVFMSSRICWAANADVKDLNTWRIPPCAENITDFTTVPKYPNSDRGTFNVSHTYSKINCKQTAMPADCVEFS